MPKTSIARKKMDSKNKRLFGQRAKGRHIKKNKSKTQAENVYVNKVLKLKKAKDGISEHITEAELALKKLKAKREEQKVLVSDDEKEEEEGTQSD